MYDEQNKKEVLSIPSCATNITSLLKRFSGRGQEIRDNFTTQGVADPRKIDQINTVLLAQDVCQNYSSPGETVFYPGGGTDTFFPTLVAQPKITVITSGESSLGSLEDINNQALDLSSIVGCYGGEGGGTFDPSTLLMGITDKGEVGNTNPHAHLLFDRAVIAHALSARKITGIDIAKLSLRDDGRPVHDKIDLKNIEGDFTFWITSKDSRTRNAEEETFSYSRLHLYIPTLNNADQEFALKKISAIHQFLSNVCPQKQLLMMQKAFPETLIETEAGKKLLSPPQNLVRTILSDQRFGQDPKQSNTATPVFIKNAKMVEKVELAKFGTAFGYGDMYIFTTNRLNLDRLYPIDTLSKERDPEREAQQNKPILSHREMYEQDRQARLLNRPAQRMLLIISPSDASGKRYDITYDPRVIHAHLDETRELLGCDPRNLKHASINEQNNFISSFSKLYNKNPKKLLLLGLQRQEHTEMNQKINDKNAQEQENAKKFDVQKTGRDAEKMKVRPPEQGSAFGGLGPTEASSSRQSRASLPKLEGVTRSPTHSRSRSNGRD